MLSQVLSELTEDGTLSLMRSSAKQAAAKAAAKAEVPAAAPRPETGDAATIEQFAAALAERDAQIAELQQAVLELASASDALSAPIPITGGEPGLTEVVERMAALESRLIEQDRTIRHTLTMLIEWIEADDAQRAAA